MRRRPPPSVDPHLAGLYASRGRLQTSRYLHFGNNDDLEDAILTMRKAVVLAEDVQSAILGQAVGSLAALLLEDFKVTGRDAALNEAMQLSILALNCSSVDAADGTLILATHGSILASLYNISRKPRHLEDAISSLQLAIQTRDLPDDGQFSTIVSNNLACVLSMRYDHTGRRGDLNDAIESALEAAEIGLSNYPSLMAKASSNLASLLARQYESTGQLDSISNALFELHMIAEVAPEFWEFDTILSHIGRLANQQHALKAQLSTGKLEMSKGNHPKSSTLFIVLSLIPVLSIVYHGSFYPLAMFLGGLLSNLALQKYKLPEDSGESVDCSLHSIADWIRKIYPAQYHPSSFTPTLLSTLWVGVSSAATLTGSDKKTFNRDTLRRTQPVRVTRFESEFDQGQRALKFPPRRKNRLQDDEGASRAVSQSSKTSPFHPSPTFRASSEIKRDDHELEAQKNQFCNRLSSSHLGDNIRCSQYGVESFETPLSTTEAGGHVERIHQMKDYVPNIIPETASSTENFNSTDITCCAEASEVSEGRDTVFSALPVSVECPSKQTLSVPSPITVQKHGPDKHDTPSPAPKPLEAKAKALASPNGMHPSDEDIELERDHKSIGKEFCDQKVRSHSPSTKTVEDSSAFDSVAQGNTTNDINRNEGNAMGNIYSEEARVIGHLSRHYGDKFETKNISAIIRGNGKAGAHQNLSGATPDRLHSEDIPQDLLDGYIDDLDERPTEEYLKHQGNIPGEKISINKPGFGAPAWPAQPPSDTSNLSYASVEAVNSGRPGKWRPDFAERYPDPRALRPVSVSSEPWPGHVGRLSDDSAEKLSNIHHEGHDGSQYDEPLSDLEVTRMPSAGPGSRISRVPPDRTSSHGTQALPASVVVDSSVVGSSDESWSETEIKVSKLMVRRKPSPNKHGLDNHSASSQYGGEATLLGPEFQPQLRRYGSGKPETKSPSQRNEPLDYSRPVRDRTKQRPKRKTTRRKHAMASNDTGRISIPPLAPDLRAFMTPYGQVEGLTKYFRAAILPVCNDVIANPPSDPKNLEFAYKALNETILAQVMMKADTIDAQDDVTRAARRKLVNEAHAALNNLDAARKTWIV